MSLPAEVHTLSIRGTLTVLDMLCVGFFQTADVTYVKIEVSPPCISLLHALCHTFLTRHRQRDQLHRKEHRKKFDWHFEGTCRVFFQEAFPPKWSFWETLPAPCALLTGFHTQISCCRCENFQVKYVQCNINLFIYFWAGH